MLVINQRMIQNQMTQHRKMKTITNPIQITNSMNSRIVLIYPSLGAFMTKLNQRMMLRLMSQNRKIQKGIRLNWMTM